MDLVRRYPKLAAQDPQQMLDLDQSFLHHNPNKDMEDTRLNTNNSKGRGFMEARAVASTEVWLELEPTRLVDKVIKIANTEDTKRLVAITTAIANSEEDGAATTDTDLATFVATRPW